MFKPNKSKIKRFRELKRLDNTVLEKRLIILNLLFFGKINLILFLKQEYGAKTRYMIFLKKHMSLK